MKRHIVMGSGLFVLCVSTAAWATWWYMFEALAGAKRI